MKKSILLITLTFLFGLAYCKKTLFPPRYNFKPTVSNATIGYTIKVEFIHKINSTKITGTLLPPSSGQQHVSMIGPDQINHTATFKEGEKPPRKINDYDYRIKLYIQNQLGELQELTTIDDIKHSYTVFFLNNRYVHDHYTVSPTNYQNTNIDPLIVTITHNFYSTHEATFEIGYNIRVSSTIKDKEKDKEIIIEQENNTIRGYYELYEPEPKKQLCFCIIQ